jgi:phage protein D
MTPGFKIKVGNTDYTATVMDHLLELRLIDAAGGKSDYLELVLDDRTPIPRPSHGERLEVSIGYLEQGLQFKGAYVHDETEFSGPPRELSIRAAAIDFRDGFNAPRTRSFDDNVTLGDLVNGIAGEYGYTCKVDPLLAVVSIPHLDQTSESDLHLLTRLADRNNALFKAAGNRILFIPKGKKSDELAQALGSVTLRPADVTTWRVTRHDKSRFNSVLAHWHDTKAAKLQDVNTGGGAPTFELKDRYPSQQEAEAAAKSKLEELNRRTLSASISLPGDPGLVAEAGLTLEEFRDGVDGDYTITRVEHRFSKSTGYQCTVQAELPDSTAAG